MGQDSLAMLLLHGKVEPEFIVLSVSDQNILGNQGVITESEGCLLKKINGIPAVKYLESLGVILLENALYVIPLLVYYEGSNMPVALGIYGRNDDGSLLCGGEMTEGASVAVGEISTEGILSSAAEGIRRLAQSGKQNGALMFPCITRYIMLTPDQDREMRYITGSLTNSLPYMLGYAGGEVCPVPDESNTRRNRVHNYTFSICAF
jgi:hypothetical protein